LSEGGLAVAVAEMAFAGNLGARIQLQDVPHDLTGPQPDVATLLFAESNSRFLCEVPATAAAEFESCFVGLPCRCVGIVTAEHHLQVEYNGQAVIASSLGKLKAAWQTPLRWN
jgi:phosphoribosylformylglycinamidine synthase